ncbi:YoaK family protein [Polluticaenibacter yanchengensis]|uniref:YoaK family protein n=1 Tax=Polluticaenibacter yanchengensis TaxID=3014562 RepID=A0ABT4UG05_9BACT|nr:YoaK family protein [Chitinophagaceae bacterium LY-5]
MLRKYNNSRSLEDNIKLGALTAMVAGLVNVASFLLFFSFTSNVTGYYAIMISELTKANLYQFAIVGLWIFAFFFGSFLSNFIVINYTEKNSYIAHATPIFLEILSLLFIGVYGNYFYTDTLIETEFLILLMLFAMGLQNGLTASISNFAVKTTHLTGATTDLAILLSMFTHKKYKHKKEVINRAKLLIAIFLCYMFGGFVGSVSYKYIGFSVFYIACGLLLLTLTYDLYKIYKVQVGTKNKKDFFDVKKLSECVE